MLGNIFRVFDLNTHAADRVNRGAFEDVVFLAHDRSFLAVHDDELPHHSGILMLENVAVIHIRQVRVRVFLEP